VEWDVNRSFCPVPSFLVGYPTFDRQQAAQYVSRQFLRGGFLRADDHPGRTVRDVVHPEEEKRTSEKRKRRRLEFPTLMNLKKMANKYRRKRVRVGL
jgi:hypothetical protein